MMARGDMASIGPMPEAVQSLKLLAASNSFAFNCRRHRRILLQISIILRRCFRSQVHALVGWSFQSFKFLMRSQVLMKVLSWHSRPPRGPRDQSQSLVEIVQA